MDMRKEIPISHCLFCSLQCPVSLTEMYYDLYIPDYPEIEGVNVGLCPKGNMISELISHWRRLNIPRIDNKKGKISEAVDQLKEELPSPEKVGLILDGNLLCEEIIAGYQWMKQEMPAMHWSIYLPPADEAFLRGASVANPSLGTINDLKASDVVLVLGDSFSTYPASAKPIFEGKCLEREGKFIVIGTQNSIEATMSYHHIDIPPSEELPFLIQVAKQLNVDIPETIQEFGEGEFSFTEKDVTSVSTAIKDAESLGVLVSSETGRSINWQIISAVVASMVEKTDGMLVPLLSYGNGKGAFQLAQTLKAEPFGKIINGIQDGEITGLFSVGCDIFEMLPSQLLGDIKEKLDFYSVATQFLPDTDPDIVFPLGFHFEASGIAITPQNDRVEIVPLLSPPAGALTAIELFKQLGLALDEIPLDEYLKEIPQNNWEDIGSSFVELKEKGDFILLADPGCIHTEDSFASRQSDWVSYIEKVPTLYMSNTDAEKLGVTRQDEVVIESNGYVETLPIEVESYLSEGVVTVSAHLPLTRKLFAWQWAGEGYPECSVRKVSIKSVSP